MGLRAQRKKLRKKFSVGDIVTWGGGVANAEIIEVTVDGVFVRDESTPRHFVPFVMGQKYGSTMKPLRLVASRES